MCRLARARLPGFAALAVLVTLGLSAAAVQTRERVAYVSVIDSETFAPIRDATPDAIAIREDGTRREIIRIAPATTPMPLAVVVDNSQAMAPAISDLRKALATFLKSVEGIGPIAIFTVGDRPTVLQQYTTAQNELVDAAGRLFHAPNSGATLLDALVDVSKGIAKRESDRAAIVVVTGENTEYSNLHYQNVLDALRDSETMMYAIVLVNPNGSVASDEARNRATVLDRGPRESGGMRIDVLTSMSFEPQLKVFGDMLKSQYRVVYGRPEALIKPERVQVSGAKPGVEAYGAPARGQGTK
jgi:VWFA-related protein